MHILVSEINFKSTFFIPIVCKFWSTKFTLIRFACIFATQ